jgi:HPt (histidine-containing phosphotransfer) domain-containing protein
VPQALLADSAEISATETAGPLDGPPAKDEYSGCGDASNHLDDFCDRAILEQLRAEGDNLLAELVGIFESELKRRLDELTQALDARDCEAAARAAHTLKGSAATFGAKHMHELAGVIDQAARRGSLDEIRAVLADFRSECERVGARLAAEAQG